MNEEIIVKLGMDVTPLAQGLRKASTTVKAFGHELSASFKDAFHHLAAPISVAGIVAGLEKALQAVKQIKAGAESLGVSTSFLQDIQNVGKAAGISSDKIESMMGKFLKKLPEGSDVEASFMKVMDRLNPASTLAAMEDPAERARIAIDNFGKAGIEVIKITGEGAEGIRKMAAGFSKFSDVDIADIEKANHAIEKLESTLTVLLGKGIANMGRFFSVLGEISAGTRSLFEAGKATISQDADEQDAADKLEIMRKRAEQMAAQAAATREAAEALEAYDKHLDDLKLKSGTAAEKLSILNKRLEEENNLADTAQSDKDFYDHLTKVRDIEEDIAKVKEDDRKAAEDAQKKEEQAAEKELKKRQQIAEASQAAKQGAQNVAESIKDRSSVTVGDLADAARSKIAWVREQNRYRSGAQVRLRLNDGEQTALDIDELEKNARQARMGGNFGRADELTKRALNLRSSISGYLTSNEANPINGVLEQSKKAASHLETLIKMASKDGDGLLIIPTEG